MGALDGRQRLRTETAGWNLDAQLVSLAGVAHLGEPPPSPLPAQPGGEDLGRALGFHGLEEGVDPVPRGGGEPGHEGAREVEARVGGEQSHGGRDARREGNDHARHAKASGQPCPVNRTGAPEGDAGERSRILAPSDRHHADGPFHVERHELMDAPGGVDHAHAERLRHVRLDGRGGRGHVETARSAQEEAGVEIAEDEIGVGHRGLASPQAVAGGPGVGARAFRPHAQDATLDAGPAPPARPDLHEIHAGDLHGETAALPHADHVDLELVSADRYAPFDQAGLGGGAAHVEGDEVLVAGEAADVRGEDGPRGGARVERAHRKSRRGVRGGDPPVVLHHVEAAREPALGEAGGESAQVLREARRDVGVDHRGIRPLVLPVLRRDIRGQDHGKPGRDLSRQLADGRLVRGVRVGVQEDHGQRLRAGVAGVGHGRAGALDVQGNVHAPVGEHALRHLEDLVARNEGRMLVEEEVVEVVAELALDLQEVAEARGGHEERARPLALDDEVGAQGRPVHDLLHLAHVARGPPRGGCGARASRPPRDPAGW